MNDNLRPMAKYAAGATGYDAPTSPQDAPGSPSDTGTGIQTKTGDRAAGGIVGAPATHRRRNEALESPESILPGGSNLTQEEDT